MFTESKSNSEKKKLFWQCFLLQIVIPIQKKSGPQSPRVIPVSPQKPSPQPAPRSAPSQPSMSAAAGHIPTKITLNKYGGGGMDFGYAPSTQRAPPATSYRPVAAPVPVRDQPDYSSHTQFSAPQKPQYSPAANMEGRLICLTD